MALFDLGNAAGTDDNQLHFVDAQTFAGNGTVVFGGANGGYPLYGYNAPLTAQSNGDSGILTIGPGITLDGKYGQIGNSSLPLINQGTIDASGGGTLYVYGSNWSSSGTLEASGGGLSLNNSWSNSGIIEASNGGSLGLNGTWTNPEPITANAASVTLAGTWTDSAPITASGGGTVVLQGTSNLAADAGLSLDGSGGTVYFQGTLNNASTTLSLNDASLTYVLQGGTINGGIVALASGATLVGTSTGGTLSGVTFDGTLDLATNSGASVTVTGGLTLNGTVDLGNAAGTDDNQLHFVGAQTFAGNGTVVFGGANGGYPLYGYNALSTAQSNGDSGILTIGSGITLDGKYGQIGNSSLPLINQGTIDASGGGTLYVYGSNWSSSGTLEASGGGLSLNNSWSNSGIIEASNGGSLGLNGTWTNPEPITVNAASVTLAGTWTDSAPITASGGGTVLLQGSSNLAADAGLSLGGSGGAVYFEGTLNNTSTTLSLNDASLTYVLQGGTINGGIVALASGASLVGTSTGGTLPGVTFDGTLDLATNSGASVTVTGGLTLNGTVDLGNAAGTDDNQLHFVGAQTFAGNGTVVFGGANGGYPLYGYNARSPPRATATPASSPSARGSPSTASTARSATPRSP